MITLGSKKKFYTGGWILIALLLLGYNGFSLISLSGPSLTGYSEEVQLASRKWRQLEERRALAEEKKKGIDLDLVLSKFLPRFFEQEERAPLSQQDGKKKSTGVLLPVLTGIMGFSDVHGNMRLLAVIDGNTYPEKAQVQGYTITDITEKGVALTKGGLKWFVSTPEVGFSLDRSGSEFEIPPETTAEIE